jgi:Xaa-Pro aminopeptidase
MNVRLESLRNLLREKNLDAVFISSIPSIIYLTNFAEFTTTDRDGYVLVTKKNQYIFTHGIYKEAVQKQVTDFTLISIKRENPISNAIKTIIQDENIKQLGFESFELKVSEYERLIKEVDKKILIGIDLISQLRIQKAPEEIKTIKKACSLGDKAYSYILKYIKAGITEKELAFELEMFIKKNGADLSFSSVVAFGIHTSQPHYVPTDFKLKRNTLVLLDFGIKIDNYCSDMTRTVFFGKVTEKQKKVYETVLDAQEKASKKIQSLIINSKSPIKANEIDNISREYILSQSFPSIPHSLGHGIGLEVHEPPRLTPVSNDTLKPGMVFSIEPGIYLPDEFGIRIEDLYTIENDRLIQLTKSPKKFPEIIQ